jgi:hypothetical protein
MNNGWIMNWKLVVWNMMVINNNMIKIIINKYRLIIKVDQ